MKKLRKIEKDLKLGKADLHIHLIKKSPQSFLRYIEKKTDLAVVAITDHDDIAKAQQAQKIAQQKKLKFEVVVGEEISSKEGHIIGLFLSKKIEPNLSLQKTLLEIKKQGGLAIASHPLRFMRFAGKEKDLVFMDGVGLKNLVRFAGQLQAVEIINGSPVLYKENAMVATANVALQKAEIGSSDAHFLSAIGQGYTLFCGKTSRDLKKAILKKQTKAMERPFSLLLFIKFCFFFLPDLLKYVWALLKSIFLKNQIKE